MFAVPPSPELPSTVTPFAAAAMYACRRFISAWVFEKASSAEAKLCEMTVASWWSTMNCSAFIIAGKPCTPSVSAGLVVMSRMLASGAMLCAHSTSRLVSRAQMLRVWLPVPLLPGGGALTWVLPFQKTCWNVGIPAEQVTPGSPHMCGRPIWVLKLPRSEAILGLPNESTMAMVTPCPSLLAAYKGARLYEACIDVGVKQRRPTEKQSVSAGGVVLPARNWKSVTAGTGAGRLLPAATMPAPAGPRPSAAAPTKVTVTAWRTASRLYW